MNINADMVACAALILVCGVGALALAACVARGMSR